MLGVKGLGPRAWGFRGFRVSRGLGFMAQFGSLRIDLRLWVERFSGSSVCGLGRQSKLGA